MDLGTRCRRREAECTRERDEEGSETLLVKRFLANVTHHPSFRATRAGSASPVSMYIVGIGGSSEMLSVRERDEKGF